jgi:hypothetical protein
MDQVNPSALAPLPEGEIKETEMDIATIGRTPEFEKSIPKAFIPSMSPNDLAWML